MPQPHRLPPANVRPFPDPARRRRARAALRRRPTTLRKLSLIVFGWVMLVLGIAGLVLPILQGVLFIVIGLSVLASVSPRARLLRVRLGRRFPILRRTSGAAQAWLRRWRERRRRRRS